MTINEIASFANVTEKTVRIWIKKTSVILPEVLPRLSVAMKTKIPADFDSNEVRLILEIGGHTTLAKLLYEVEQRPMALNQIKQFQEAMNDVLNALREVSISLKYA